MINIGVIGLGMMGTTHLDAYAKNSNVNIFAVSDIIPSRLSGEEVASGNVEGQAKGSVDLSQTKRYAEGKQLIADPDVHLVDICLPTPLHMEYAVAALQAGKHVMVEKPYARTHAEAIMLADATEQASGLSMCGMCMRFWPGWDWLKQTIDDKTYGRVLAASFRRVASHPGGPFYTDGEACGGAVLDLHIHDTDFVQYCFGTPKAVFSRGYSKITGRLDHVLTHYVYEDETLITAEGGWAMADGYGFQMQFTINFEKASVEYSFDGSNNLKLIEPGKEPRMLDIESGMGYDKEIAYFLDCISNNQKPRTVTPAQAAESVRIVEAEAESIRTGHIISL